MRCLRFTSRFFRVFSDKESVDASSTDDHSTELVKKKNSSKLIPVTAVKETHTISINYEQATSNKLINQYMLIKELGRGVHGKVKLGKDLETGEFVAIKIIERVTRRRLGQHNNDLTNEQRIRREIFILKKCIHPHVVRLKEVIDDPRSKKIYMVIEYMEGGEIKWKDEYDNPTMAINEARKIFRDVVLGLEYLHHQGIIHRDIKPANLLLTTNHEVKISDFGVSHFSQQLAATVSGNNSNNNINNSLATQDDTDLAKTAGSPAFFAPELCYSGEVASEVLNASKESDDVTNMTPETDSLPYSSIINGHNILQKDNINSQPSSRLSTPHKNRPPITKAIDIWALGVTLYCFIFGRCPFTADTEFELFFRVIPHQPLQFPDNIPITSDLKDLLMRLLEKDPLKRITLDEVKKHSWVIADISNPEKWREDTDPRRYQMTYDLKIPMAMVVDRVR